MEKLTENEIFVFTEDGDLVIRGEGLSGGGFDPSRGVITVTGHINSLCYITEKYHMPDNFLSRLLK